MKLKGLAVLVVLLLAAAPVSAAVSITVTAAAALQGNFGMRVNFDGTVTNAYVQDNSPANEAEYHATFRIRADGMVMAPEATLQIFRAFEETSGANVFRLNLYRRPNGQATLWAFHILPARSAAAGGGFYPRIAEALRDGGDQFTVEWHKGTAATIRLYRNGNFRKKAENLNTNDFDIDYIRLGGGLGSTGGVASNGSFLDLDDFISTRTCQFASCNF